MSIRRVRGHVFRPVAWNCRGRRGRNLVFHLSSRETPGTSTGTLTAPHSPPLNRRLAALDTNIRAALENALNGQAARKDLRRRSRLRFRQPDFSLNGMGNHRGLAHGQGPSETFKRGPQAISPPTRSVFPGARSWDLGRCLDGPVAWGCGWLEPAWAVRETTHQLTSEL